MAGEVSTARAPVAAAVGRARGWWAWLRAQSPGRRDCAALVLLGVLARTLTALLIHHPGYIDAAYYYEVARNVAAGHGLTEDVIVTYLVPAPSVTHASNLWWMPGASLLLVPFFWVFGPAWWVAQLPNVVLTGTLPALAYLLGRDLVGTRRVALGAGLLTITSGFYYPLYDPMPDNFGLYAWAAGGALLLLGQGARGRPWRFALAGLCCGVAHLARAEAPLLLAVAVAVWWWARRVDRATAPPAWSLAAFFGLYAGVMAPWFARNLLLLGTPLPPGGLQSAWLRQYNDFFSYGLPLTPASYLAWGLGPIVWSKVQALGVTLRQLAAVMDFVLAPFALLGLWRLRRRLAALPWLLFTVGAYLALNLIFTFPSLYGTVLHAEVAAFPFLNVAAIVGLDASLEWLGGRQRATSEAARRRGRARTEERQRVYLGGAVALSAVLSAFLIVANAQAWDATARAYADAGRMVARDAARPGAGTPAPVVMVVDPANFYYETGERAVMLPDQPLAVMARVARRYDARYLVLEPAHSAAQDDLWSGRQRTPLLTLVWSGPGIKLYRWNW